MIKITYTPEIRFEKTHPNHITVLEGSELNLLLKHCMKYFKKYHKKGKKFNEIMILSSTKAYDTIYGNVANLLDELENSSLITGDARKLDLLYQGFYSIVGKALYPDINWDEELNKKESPIEILNRIVELKPNIVGIGVNINELIDKLILKK